MAKPSMPCGVSAACNSAMRYTGTSWPRIWAWATMEPSAESALLAGDGWKSSPSDTTAAREGADGMVPLLRADPPASRVRPAPDHAPCAEGGTQRPGPLWLQRGTRWWFFCGLPDCPVQADRAGERAQVTRDGCGPAGRCRDAWPR